MRKVCDGVLLALSLLLGGASVTGAQAVPPDRVYELREGEITEEKLLEILLPRADALGQPRGITIAPPAGQATPRCQVSSRGLGVGAKVVSDAAALQIEFDTGSSNLLPAASVKLDVVGRVLSKPPLAWSCFRIEGHADSVGSDVYNQRLSKLRAQAVTRYLTKRFQIAPDQLEVAGYGESSPIADNDTAAGRARNRRVQIVTLASDAAIP